MPSLRGFSLLEVLISLLLITHLSLMVLEQQWQIARYLHGLEVRHQTYVSEHNAWEISHA